MFKKFNTIKTTKLLLVLLTFCLQMTPSFALYEGLYCGRENCYDGMHSYLTYLIQN